MHGSAPVNLLFIITAQQRWDALGCMVDTMLKTPKSDRHERNKSKKLDAERMSPVIAD